MARSMPPGGDPGERQIARHIDVDAPAGELFALIANPHRHHEFDGSGTVRDQQVKGPVEIAPGDTFTVPMKMFGLSYFVTSTATEIERDRVVEWRHPGGHRWRYEFVPLGNGQTRVTEIFDYRESRVAKIYELIGMPGKNVTGIERTLENLANLFA